LKSIKCSKCGKIVEVKDEWQYTRCEICRTKDLAYKQVLKDKRKLDREARNRIKELKLEKAMNFSEWSKFAQEKLNNPNPNWEQYLDYLKQRKEHEIFDKADRETYRLKAENQQKYRLICQDLFPFKNERECYSFRLSRLNGSKDVRHLNSCEDCSDWDYNFVNDMLPQQDERESSEKIDPIDRWETEQWRKRGATLPDDSLDRFKPKQKSETEAMSDAIQKDNVKVEPLEQEPQNKPENLDVHSEPETQNEPQPSEPLDPQQYIEQMFQRKQNQQPEDGNEDQKTRSGD
jgi:DNA-directed RNA polymerase subunit RPC12/RpoP